VSFPLFSHHRTSLSNNNIITYIHPKSSTIKPTHNPQKKKRRKRKKEKKEKKNRIE
jgi:hypothetical protein